MNTQVCVIGTVATDPRMFETAAHVPVCSFRIANNERRYDRESKTWVDGGTNWFTVSAFRGLAEHARDSFAKGDRVIVSGRLRVRKWETDEKSGLSVDIEADAIGHDVRFGVSTFRKHRSSGGTEDSSATQEGDASSCGDEGHDRWGARDSETPNDRALAEHATSSTSPRPTEDFADSDSLEQVLKPSDGFTPALS